MTTVIGGSSPSITFSDSTTQSTAALPLTGGQLSGNLTFATGTNGIIFNNSSAAINSTLNDYETGTWTPVASGGLSTTGTATFIGTYTKIGNLVRINFKIGATTIACSAGTNILTNIPFSSNIDGTGNYGSGIGLTGNYNYVFQAYGSLITAYTTITGVNQVYGSIVYQATF